MSVSNGCAAVAKHLRRFLDLGGDGSVSREELCNGLERWHCFARACSAYLQSSSCS